MIEGRREKAEGRVKIESGGRTVAVHTRDINVSTGTFPRAYAAVKFLCNTCIQETYLFEHCYNIDSVHMSGDLAELFNCGSILFTCRI